MELKDKLFTSLENNHVIGVCLLSQSEPEKHNKGKKGPHTFAHLKQMCRPCLIIIQSCYFDCRINKPFAYSRCLVCISCSVHVISLATCAKDHVLFFIFIQVKEVRRFDRTGVKPNCFSCSQISVHHVKNAGAVLEPGTIVAKLELDDPSRVTQVQ